MHITEKKEFWFNSKFRSKFVESLCSIFLQVRGHVHRPEDSRRDRGLDVRLRRRDDQPDSEVKKPKSKNSKFPFSKVDILADR